MKSTGKEVKNKGLWSDSGRRKDKNSLVKDIKSHGYTEKAVKQCGMRYLGPHFYGNWSPDRALNDDGTCADADVNYATQFSDRNVRYWYLGMCRALVFSSIIAEILSSSRRKLNMNHEL